MPEDSAARFVRESEFSELISGNAGNSVMVREPLINKRIVRRPDVQCVVILMYLAFEEEPRFGSESLPQTFIGVLNLVE